MLRELDINPDEKITLEVFEGLMQNIISTNN